MLTRAFNVQDNTTRAAFNLPTEMQKQLLQECMQ